MDKDNFCHEDQKNDPKGKKVIRIHYTKEEKIVSAVWCHEKPHTQITHQELAENFIVRFNKKPPLLRSVLLWEKALFSNHGLKKLHMKKRTKQHYMQIPYVKESFKTHPYFSFKQRARLLGLCTTIVYRIIKDEISVEEIERLKQEGQKDTAKESQEQGVSPSHVLLENE